MGDPAGIGPEITHKAWLARKRANIPPFFVIGDPSLYPDAQAIAAPEAAKALFADALPVLPEAVAVPPRAGTPDARNSAAVISAIRRAAACAASADACAMVTAPIAKAVLYEAGFPFPGHTEFLADLAGVDPRDIAMMLAAPDLRVVPQTIHVALRDVAPHITREAIVRRARIVLAALHADFAVARPRLAVAGLNPHAGEGGALGREEIEAIAPAVAELRGQGHDVTGPHAADTLFHAEARAGYDAVLAMYHDQALIPLKTLAFHDGVNITLGLPFVRTSPDHGAAFAIAGRDAASPASMIAALAMAGRVAANRARHGG